MANQLKRGIAVRQGLGVLRAVFLEIFRKREDALPALNWSVASSHEGGATRL